MFVVPLPRGEGYANLVWQAGLLFCEPNIIVLGSGKIGACM